MIDNLNEYEEKVYKLCNKRIKDLDLNSESYINRLNSEMNDLVAWREHRQVPYAKRLLDSRNNNKKSDNPCGSLIVYLLELCEKDPVKIKQKRELADIKPWSGDFPDIDIDFSKTHRDKVKNFILEKFGHEYVCNVGSWGNFKTKQTIKDVARVFCHDHFKINIITKNLEKNYGGKVNEDGEAEEEEKLDKIPMESLMTKDENIKELFEEYPYLLNHINKIRGQIKARGQHAAGMIISSVKLFDWIPLHYQNDLPTSFWVEGLSDKEIQKFGFIKYDVLGLKTVSIIYETLNTIEKNNIRIIGENGQEITIHLNDFVLVKSDNGKEKKIRAKEIKEGDIISQVPNSVKLLK